MVLRLSRQLGIDANLIDVQEGATRSRFAATLRHALPFVFQPQFVVANPAILFGNIEDAWRQRALKDTFPFFLGAVAEKELNLELDLEEAKRDQKRAQRHLDEVVALRAQGYERAKSLTVRVKLDGTWRSIAEIGSEANWVGYHLLALLSLHRDFIENERPVPAFLLLDQPSQVYFPPDPLDGDKGDITKRLEGLPENSPRQAKALKDREALKALYKLLFDAVRQSQGRLQIIVTDHANLLDEPDFQNAITEEWRDGRALIQEPWPIGPTA